MSARVTPQQIRAIHIAKSRAGLGEAEYRGLLATHGVTTSKALSRDAAEQLLAQMPGASSPLERKGASGPYAAKLQALWIAGWNLGIVRDRTDAALHSFVERQTGLAHTRFLREHKAAAKAIEALKAWLARDGGVEWPKAGSRSASSLDADPIDLKRAVLRAQLKRLSGQGTAEALRAIDYEVAMLDLDAAGLDALSAEIGRLVRPSRGRTARAA